MLTLHSHSVSKTFTRALCLKLCAALLMCSICSEAAGQVDSQNFAAGTSDRESLPTERTLDYDFESISVASIERWLSWVNVSLPVDAVGEVSGWVWAQRSSRGLFDFRDYWLEGEITSPELKIDKWIVKEAKLRFGYRGGVWYVGRLKGAVVPPEQNMQAGRVELAAQLPLDRQALLNLSGTISQVDLASLLNGLAVDFPIKNTGGELTFSARVPLDRANDLKYWTGNANLSMNDVIIPPLRDPVAVTANAGLQDGQWRLRDSRFLLQSDAGVEIPLRVGANGPLESPWPFSVNASSANVALEELLRQFGLHAWAKDVQGNAEVTATATGNSDVGIDAANLNIQTNDLIIQQQSLGGMSLVGNVLGQAANVQLQSASFLGGTLLANADWRDLRRTQEGKPNRVSFSLDGIRLDKVGLPWLANRVAGVATGRVTFQTESNQAGRTTWGSDGELAVVDSALEGASLGNIELRWSKAIDQSEGRGSIRLAKEDGQAAANLFAKFMDDGSRAIVSDRVESYHATGSLENFTASVPATALMQAAGNLAAKNQVGSVNEPVPVRATGRFDVAGSMNEWFERGSAELTSLDTRIAGRDVQLTQAIVEATPEELRLRQFTLREFVSREANGEAVPGIEGRVLGAAILRRDGEGEHLLRLALSDVAISPYWNLIAPQAYSGFDGRISSVVQITLPANIQRGLSFSSLSGLSQAADMEMQGNISGSVRGLSFRDEAIGDFDFRGEVNNGELKASAEGGVLQGRAEIDIEVSDVLKQLFPSEKLLPRESPIESRIDARLENIELATIVALAKGSTQKVDARGIGSITFRAEAVGGKLQTASGRLSVPSFFHNRELFAQNLEIDFDLADSKLRINQAQGRIARGLVNVSGSIGWPLNEEHESAGDLVFAIQQVDVGQLAMLLYPSVAEQFSGRMSYRGRGRLGRSLTFLGSATTTNAVIYSIPLQSVRGSLQLDFNRGGSFQNLVANNLVGTAVGGRLVADIRLRGGSSYNLQAEGRVRRGKMEQLSKSLGFERIVGSEKFDALFVFSSRDATSLNALRGNLQLDFGQGDAQSVPILADLNRLVPLMQLASTDITSGRMNARIGQGLLIIEDLLLNSEAFWIAGNGSASLSSGNLNLQGVLQTGGGIEAQVSQASVRRLATLLLPEVVFIAELDNLLRNRTLYFRVRGNADRPVIQPKIAPSIVRGLLQEVKRSLLAAPRIIAISDK